MIDIIGKNGAGKTYIANELYQLGFQRNTGYTTRPMRPNEKNGIDYFFVEKEEFEDFIKNNELADYKKRNDYYYGILKNNIKDNTILVSGNVQKIEECTNIKVTRIYIDCDLKTRYKRVLTRNDSLQNTFNRFHTENFSYLNDFNAVYIDNSLTNNNALIKIIDIITNSVQIEKSMHSNKDFIERKVNEFELNKYNDINDNLLSLLNYEEYILRRLFLEKKDLTSTLTKDKYNNYLSEFMITNNIQHNFTNNELCVNINDIEYNFDYKVKRKSRE